jgi:hypothetical protein
MFNMMWNLAFDTQSVELDNTLCTLVIIIYLQTQGFKLAQAL